MGFKSNCKYCQKPITHWALSNHERSHEEPNTCSKCNKKFKIIKWTGQYMKDGTVICKDCFTQPIHSTVMRE